MRINEYFEIIKGWERQYGTPPKIVRFDPTETSALCCRCRNHRRKMARHHIANDFFFANLLPNQYAARYIAFLDEDVRRICDRCHKAIHEFMSNAYHAMLSELPEFHALKTMEAKIAWCEKWKATYREMFEVWMKKYRPRSSSVTKSEAKNGKPRSKRRRKRVRKNRTQGRRRKRRTVLHDHVGETDGKDNQRGA